jgi:SAM-dependent methyltransferase
MDALAMEFDDDTFDLVWACESGEHMPDKKKYVEEMTRVLAPGGRAGGFGLGWSGVGGWVGWCDRSAPSFGGRRGSKGVVQPGSRAWGGR